MQETNVAVLRSIWRFVRNTVLIILGIGVLTGLGFWFVNYLHERQVAKVLVLISTDCNNADYPLNVRVLNGSSKTVESLYLTMSARKPGHSTDLVQSGGRDWDRIIKPNEGYGYCYQYPDLKGEKDFSGGPVPGAEVYDKKNLEWSARLIYVRFAD